MQHGDLGVGRESAADIAALLRIIPAAVSGAVRYLTQVGLIEREREPGRWRDHYRVRDDLWYETVMQREEMLASWQRSLEAGVEAVGPDSAAGRRLEGSWQFFGFLREERPALMAEWRRQRASG